MELYILFSILILLVAALGAGLYFVYQRLASLGEPEDAAAQKMMLDIVENLRKEVSQNGTQNRQEMQARLDQMTALLQKSHLHQTETISSHFRESGKIIEDITRKLTQVEGTNKQILGFSEKLQSLENILKNPKQRGILGEYFLETLLAHVLQPNQYKMQYKFTNGEIVDAAIFMQDKIVPIDAKFSLEKYNKIMEATDEDVREKLQKEFKMDVKNRIDETAKYIRPSENTTDFAFMFIPAEGIYYNLLIYKVGNADVRSQDLIEYAFGKRVIIVSPTSFFAYLQTVLQGLKALKMEQSVKEVIKRVGELGRHLTAYEAYMQKLGNNLGTSVNAYNTAYKELKKIDKDVVKISGDGNGGAIEPEFLDRPQTEE
jgi:DNA recombination protein RmuC